MERGYQFEEQRYVRAVLIVPSWNGKGEDYSSGIDLSEVLIVPSWNGKLFYPNLIVLVLFVLIVPSWNGKGTGKTESVYQLGINRTIVEWKDLKKFGYGMNFLRINRTIVELTIKKLLIFVCL